MTMRSLYLICSCHAGAIYSVSRLISLENSPDLWDLFGPWVSLSVILPASFLSGSETDLFIYSCSSLGNLRFSSYTDTAQAPSDVSSAFLAVEFFWKAHTFHREVDAVPTDKLHWQEAGSTHSSLLQTNHNCSACFILSQEWNTWQVS